MTLIKAGKSSFNFLLLFLFLIAGSIFFDLKKADAADIDVVINEAMVDPSCTSDYCEWIELYNNGQDVVNLKNWRIDGKEILNDIFLQPEDYLVVTRNLIEFNKIWTVDQNKVIQLTIGLTNSSDIIKIDNNDTYEEIFSWDEAPNPNISWEKIDSLDISDDNWHESLFDGGTPGQKNSVSRIAKPSEPLLFSPLGEFTTEDKIEFDWRKEENISYSVIVATDPELKNIIGISENYPAGIYYWQVIASNLLYDVESVIATFEISEPKYCDKIIINEIMANPVGDEVSGEWIELYNGCNGKVNLKNWSLSDIEGSFHKFTIDDELFIEPFGYVIIYRDDSGITLNNDGDGARLYQPNGHLLSQASYLNDGKEGYSWARGQDGKWSWTEKPTPKAKNIIQLTSEEENNEETEELINTVPIGIQTGDYQDYLDRLVKIIGKVTSTSGNTFYLDDGSGEVKIYIQEKTGIEKPEMHKNDIFEIVGIVDLYGKTWRILPRYQNDIKLAEAAPKIVKSSAVKTSTKKENASSVSSSIQNKTTNKRVASAEDLANEKENKTSFWMQIVKAFTGLAAVFLIILIIKILKKPKEKTIGGHFGEDDT